MSGADRPVAVFLDAYGTLVELDDPIGRLRQALRDRGVEASAADVAAAFRAEVSFYRRNQDTGRDAAGVASLRDECAKVFAAALPGPAPPVGLARDALVEGLRYRLFDDVVPALEALRAGGRTLAVVSNWDASLEGVLADLGVRRYFGAVVASAVVGVRKPDPGIFRETCRRLSVQPSEVLHVGDDPVTDGDGARRAGIAFRRIDRSADHEASAVRSLTDLVESLDED